jgi:membrane dipeptidase
MNPSTIDLSRRRALKALGAAGVLGASGCAGMRTGDADVPVMMDGHVHITNRIYWEKIDPWMPHDGGWDYARARASE